MPALKPELINATISAKIAGRMYFTTFTSNLFPPAEHPPQYNSLALSKLNHQWLQLKISQNLYSLLTEYSMRGLSQNLKIIHKEFRKFSQGSPEDYILHLY